MATHDLYEKHFTLATAVMAEGARVGFAACKTCGVCVLLDPRDGVNRARQHYEWHQAIDAMLAERGRKA